MATALRLPDEAKKSMSSAICKMVEEGRTTKYALEYFGISWATWHEWRAGSPEIAEMYARAQETWAEHMVQECPSIAADETKDAKSRRVIVETNLKVAALLCPKRFSQAALDRIAAPPEEEQRLTTDELAAAMLRSLSVASRAQLPAPVDAEFTELDDDDL